ncbi:Rpn family recombination-promoting nuclease/putative transposase [Skermanella rosea]|uniref:Rpn family recombination-promoting nuclease/putative transposase n=1 Tax=Skermanella rosea TaxID=1817965 RepID=UPI0019330A04|nr:Rpn family recombination-promoting nuclease/putative transposase [Skermanella rosea]UEM05904.1 Rpn family recombination-promoting nuclease/putative transposase [Skermanella rosea]
MTRGSSHHDHIAKTLLGRPATAATFLRERLPPAIVALMSPDPPVRLSGSFIDSDQRDSDTDLLCRIGLRSGGCALAQVLIEHDGRRRPTSAVLSKLLRYIALTGEDHFASGGKPPLPPVIPLVICHGTRPWAEPPDYSGLYDVGPELAPFVPKFAYTVFDMRTTVDEERSCDPFLRFGLAVMKLARGRRDFRRRLLALATDEVDRDDRIVQLFIYMINVYTDLDRPTLDMLAAPLSKEERDEVATMAQRLYADGKADGRAEGRTEGKTELLLEMLEYRFGPVPNEVRSRVSRLDPGSITLMVRRALEAASLEQALNPRKD